MTAPDLSPLQKQIRDIVLALFEEYPQPSRPNVHDAIQKALAAQSLALEEAQRQLHEAACEVVNVVMEKAELMERVATADTQRAEARQQIAEKERQRAEQHSLACDLTSDNMHLRKRLAVLREALRKFGRHTNDCQMTREGYIHAIMADDADVVDPNLCTCGFAALLQGETEK